MVQQKHGPETSYENQAKHRMQIIYTGKMRERQIFMQELKELRKHNTKIIFKSIVDAAGPKWYQALSVPQRSALDTLAFSIHQDLLEGIPVRTANVMRELGLFPRPNTIDLMNCVYLGRRDPKEMLSQLFLMTYGHSVDGRRTSYCLNAKLMLSGILYLGLDNLITLLRERFKPDTKPKAPTLKAKAKKDPPVVSPYLQKMVAVLYERPVHKRQPPLPLPNLDELNEPYEEDPPMPKPSPPPPPPPPPKKRLARSYCDKLAGITNIEPYSDGTTITIKTVTQTSHRKLRGSKLSLSEQKKAYGISMVNRKRGGRRRKPVVPSTGISNAQYVINGVFIINGKSMFILSSVSILPSAGDIIHGGYRYLGDESINIHCGVRGLPPPPMPDPCDCVKKWQDTVFQYIRRTKCYCGHHYDYGNEGTFLSEELPFFQKPTRNAPYLFNYHTIYDLDKKSLHVEKEFKRIWDTDSLLHVDDSTQIDKKDKKKKKAKRSSTTCLGQNPKPEDYLQCALRLMRRANVAARLPDIHLVPELKEWMRRRIYGSYSRIEKLEKLRMTSTYWQILKTLANKGYGHVYPPKDPIYSGHTNWLHKQELNEKFKKFTHRYKLSFFRSQAKVINLLWSSMCQAEFPDKKFREIYFSYLFGRMENIHIMHPYSSRETIERKLAIGKRRYYCPPAGIEPAE